MRIGSTRTTEHPGRADLVIVNVYMPKQAGPQWIRSIQAAHPNTPVHRDLGSVPIRVVRLRGDRTQLGGRPGDRQAAGAHRSARGGARYHRGAGLMHAALHSPNVLTRSCSDPMLLRSDSTACGWGLWCSASSSSWLSPDRPPTTPGVPIGIRSTRPSARSVTRRTRSPSKPSWTLQAVDLLLLDTGRWYRSDSQAFRPSVSTRRSRFARPDCSRCARS